MACDKNSTKTYDPVINDIKVIRFEPTRFISVKLNYTEYFIELPTKLCHQLQITQGYQLALAKNNWKSGKKN